MKWPLKFQIMVPLTLVMLGTVLGMSAAQAYWAASQRRQQIAQRIRDVTETLTATRSNFPLTSAVLIQMKGLSGADFVLRDGARGTIASTLPEGNPLSVADWDTTAGAADFELGEPISIAGQRLFHAAVAVRPRGPASNLHTLHVLYPENEYVRQQQQAILPALVVGSVAVVVVVLLALVTASRVSRPLGRLREQVHRMAEGDFQPLDLPSRDDEVRDLAQAVNHMAATLADYEQQIRRTEQVRLLGQLGSGLAHQLRNSATGARMALDIHRGECLSAVHRESLDVATRQLILMEKYLAKFLSLAAPARRRHEPLDFAELVRSLTPLVHPAARHAGVKFEADIPETAIFVCGDADGLEHMVLNLLINAIEAAGQVRMGQLSVARSAAPRVLVHMTPLPPDHVVFSVEDTGQGPPEEIAAHICDPFVTGKRDGIGLGLAVARDVALEHHGSLHWERVTTGAASAQVEQQNGITRFRVELPLAQEKTHRGNSACR